MDYFERVMRQLDDIARQINEINSALRGSSDQIVKEIKEAENNV